MNQPDKVKSARCGALVFKRADEAAEWTHKNYPSISQAKRANGLNAITVKSGDQLPKQVAP